jgi:hypothetical protein
MRLIPSLLLALSLAAGACGRADKHARMASTSSPVAAAEAQPCDDPFAGVSLGFAPDGWKTDFCQRSVPLDEIHGGGPPRDGIPPIDAPAFVSVVDADRWLADREPVIRLEIEGDARAYPLQILMWHEIVNDVIGGRPVAVTFCPLCYAAMVFERPVVDGRTLTFGTSGNLRHSDLVMWDRQTETWWQQFTGEAIVGVLTGTELVAIPAPIISWAEFKASRPRGRVLSRDTGHDRPYGANPYVGYDDVSKRPFLYKGDHDGRLPPMERVVGVAIGQEARAYRLDSLRASRAINDTVGGEPVVVLWRPGTASAMDTEVIATGRDIGATGVFSRQVGDRALTFEPAGDAVFRDRETGTTWNTNGRAVAGQLAGRSLEPRVQHDVFWFVWSTFKPGATVYEP